MAAVDIWRPDPYDPNTISREEHRWTAGNPNISARVGIAHGFLRNVPLNSTRKDIFLEIFGAEARASIIAQTNEQLRVEPVRATHRSLDEAEFRVFLAVKLMMRVAPGRTLVHHFLRPGPAEPRGNAWIRSRIGYHRFSALNSHLRLTLGIVFHCIIENSLRLRQPCNRIAFDESMILYQGHDCVFRVRASSSWCNFVECTPQEPVSHGGIL